MTGSKLSEQAALSVLEALAASVEDMSDEDVAEEIRREGKNPEAEAKTLQQDLLAFVVGHQRQMLREQHANSHRQLTHAGRRIPSTSAGRRVLLQRTLEQAPPGLTVQGRNLEEIPDDELESWLIDLAALGCLLDEE